jgi:hypothetical protein
MQAHKETTLQSQHAAKSTPPDLAECQILEGVQVVSAVVEVQVGPADPVHEPTEDVVANVEEGREAERELATALRTQLADDVLVQQLQRA